MPRIALGTTGITATRIGFGCGSLFRLPTSEDRRALLDAAYDAGIRHFDVAPSYGLGRAEEELGRFVRGRRSEVTIATKYGLQLSGAATAAAGAQRALRVALDAMPALKKWVVRRRLAYAKTDHGPGHAQASLEKSLRALGVDALDLFFVHEPPGAGIPADALAQWKSEATARGAIRAFGAAGAMPAVAEAARAAPSLVDVAQFDNDLLGRQLEREGRELSQPVITFGSMRPASMLSALARDRGFVERIRAETGFDLSKRDDLSGILLAYALRANPRGVVLVFTSKKERIASLVRWEARAAAETEALSHVFSSLREVAGAAPTAHASLT